MRNPSVWDFPSLLPDGSVANKIVPYFCAGEFHFFHQHKQLWWERGENTCSMSSSTLCSVDQGLGSDLQIQLESPGKETYISLQEESRR